MLIFLLLAQVLTQPLRPIEWTAPSPYEWPLSPYEWPPLPPSEWTPLSPNERTPLVTRLSPNERTPLSPKFPTRCITPNQDFGVCIEIHRCEIFLNAIKEQKNETYEFLRASRCGPENEDPAQPRVCCGRTVEFQREMERQPEVVQVPTLGHASRPLVHKPSQSTPQVLFPRNCGMDHILTSRISGGKEAELGEFPWMARLRHRSLDGKFTYGCAGFLISERFVLTAAHCISSPSLAPLGPIYQVQLGEHNTRSDPDCLPAYNICQDSPQLLKAATPHITVHPNYTGPIQQYNDIAVIPLEEVAVFTNSVQPICLPETPAQNGPVWVAGWGQTEKRNFSPVKLRALLNIADKAKCTKKYTSVEINLRESQICADGTNGQDSCTGDSGGPLMDTREDDRWYAEGIVSFGYGCAEPGWPGVYTSTAHMLAWVKSVMNEYLRENA